MSYLKFRNGKLQYVHVKRRHETSNSDAVDKAYALPTNVVNQNENLLIKNLKDLMLTDSGLKKRKTINFYLNK
jgi:hypothetical protein